MQQQSETPSGSTSAGVNHAPRTSANGALWLIGISLAVIAACMLGRVGQNGPGWNADGLANTAFAQSVGTSGARGVFAFSGPMTKGTNGVFMVDVDRGTIWCYELLSGDKQLKLIAARDWRYDRYLENYHTDPPPKVIQDLLEDQRRVQGANPSTP